MVQNSGGQGRSEMLVRGIPRKRIRPKKKTHGMDSWVGSAFIAYGDRVALCVFCCQLCGGGEVCP